MDEYNLIFEVKQGFKDGKRGFLVVWETWAFGRFLGKIYYWPTRTKGLKFEAIVFGLSDRTVPQRTFQAAVSYLFRKTFVEKLEQVLDDDMRREER